MQLELTFSNEPRGLPVAQTFVQEALRQVPLSAETGWQLGELVLEAARHAVAHAYPEGEEGTIRLTVREEHGKLEVLVRDWGLPQDVALLERQLHQPGAPAGLPGSHGAGAADEVHWLAYGPQGKAFQILKWLSDQHIEDHPEAGPLQPFREDAPLAPEQTYMVRRMRPEEAVQVAQLMYRTYGNTYFNADVYYPERIAAQNARGVLLSVVAQGEDGRLAGHCALERGLVAGPVAEVGQAVVDPAHRGRGLMNRMKEALLEEAGKLDLVGWYANAVAVHTLTQKVNVSHGGHACGVSLAVSPRTEQFRGLAETLPQRVSCILYYHWLREPAARDVYAPARHRDLIAAIYENLQCPVRFAEGSPPPGHGTLSVKMIAGAGTAFIQAEQLGADTSHPIRHAKRTLVEQSRAEAVFVELPLSDPCTPHVAEELEAEGFGFTGVAPHFSARGDLLQLVYLVTPLAREPIHTYEEWAGRLVDYALAEQARLRDL